MCVCVVGINYLNDALCVAAKIKITENKIWHWSVYRIFVKSASESEEAMQKLANTAKAVTGEHAAYRSSVCTRARRRLLQYTEGYSSHASRLDAS